MDSFHINWFDDRGASPLFPDFFTEQEPSILTSPNQGPVAEDLWRPIQNQSNMSEEFAINVNNIPSENQTSGTRSAFPILMTSKDKEWCGYASKTVMSFIISTLMTDCAKKVLRRNLGDDDLIEKFLELFPKGSKYLKSVNWNLFIELTRVDSERFLHISSHKLKDNQVFQANKEKFVKTFSALVLELLDEYQESFDSQHKLMPAFRELVKEAINNDPSLFHRPQEKLMKKNLLKEERTDS
eukprot:TRINITY_DN21996_c0_g2_i2.p1 TRINITY_DN21996_c0_g2~~TRINITY_DN21996_c0_g2_i2.p1  ORF type:complete len:241 (-),score=15.55 TRINITY_DN21996_c0_g2_i2:91-813(-)